MNEEICLKIVVTLIDERMRESRGEQLMGRKSSWSRIKEQKKGRGRPKITLVEVIIKDMSIREVTEGMISDRI